MPLSTTFNWTRRVRRLLDSLSRLWFAIHAPKDLLILTVLYWRLYTAGRTLKGSQDGLRALLEAPWRTDLIPNRSQEWIDWLRLVIPFVPYARRHRCLVGSVVGFQVAQGKRQSARFVLGVAPKTGGGTEARFHAWLELSEDQRLDWDRSQSYQPLFVYPP